MTCRHCFHLVTPARRLKCSLFEYRYICCKCLKWFTESGMITYLREVEKANHAR